MIMDEILTPEQWADLQAKLRLRFPELTETDLQYEEAAEPDMLRMVEYKLHKTHFEMKGIIVWL
jgi:hypothetical protein